jgi:CRISPR-associated endoribonuclease Cas6
MRLSVDMIFPDSYGISIHYNYWLQSLIYHMMDGEMADQVHALGFGDKGRRFRLFTFSRLMGRYELSHDKKQIHFPGGAKWIISSPIPDILASIAGGLLKRNTIPIGTSHVEITGIQTSHPRVKRSKILVRTLSPVVAYSTMFRGDNSKYTLYFQPGEPEFKRIVTENLIKKNQAIQPWIKLTTKKHLTIPGGDGLREQELAPNQDLLELRVRRNPRLHIIEYKGGVIKGYSGDMELHGSPSLLQVAVDAGLGSKNSQGFGCLEVIR